MLTLLVSAFVRWWLCWYMNYFPYIDFLLKWESARWSEVDGQGLNIYKVVCWYRFKETSVFKLHVTQGRKLAHTADWVWMVTEVLVGALYSDSVNLGIPEARTHYTGTMHLSPVWLLRSSRCWVNLFIIQYGYKVTMMQGAWCLSAKLNLRPLGRALKENHQRGGIGIQCFILESSHFNSYYH